MQKLLQINNKLKLMLTVLIYIKDVLNGLSDPNNPNLNIGNNIAAV